MSKLFPTRPLPAPGVLRLDSLVNPYAPTDAVAEALADLDLNTTSDDAIARGLRSRLGRMVGVDERWVVLANGIDALYAGIVSWRLGSGPFAVFPPSHLDELQRVLDLDGDIHVVPRTEGFGLGLSAAGRRFPERSTSVVMSPNDPTGTLVDLHELVRLSRQSELVVVDERHAAYTPRTTAHLAREFENLIVLQSMEWWAGLIDHPIAWAICPPSIGRQLHEALPDASIDRSALVAAQATLDDWVWLHGTLRRLTMEKGRLYRQLRKLNMLHAPQLSWANFVLTRFARGGVDFFAPLLAERGIHVFVPDQDILPGSMRVSAISAEATEQLKRALIEIALDL